MSILQRCPLRESLLYLLTWTNTSLASLKVRFTHTFEVSSGYVVLVVWKGEREGIGAMSYRDVHDFCTVTELMQKVWVQCLRIGAVRYRWSWDVHFSFIEIALRKTFTANSPRRRRCLSKTLTLTAIYSSFNRPLQFVIGTNLYTYQLRKSTEKNWNGTSGGKTQTSHHLDWISNQKSYNQRWMPQVSLMLYL